MKIKRKDNSWGEWKELPAAEIIKHFKGHNVERARYNNKYLVAQGTEWSVLGRLEHIRIARKDRRAVTDQSDLYRIKNELFGKQADVMVWLYGSDSGDYKPVTAHMFVSEDTFPFGPRRVGHETMQSLVDDQVANIISGLSAALSVLLITVGKKNNLKFGINGALKVIESVYGSIEMLEEIQYVNEESDKEIE